MSDVIRGEFDCTRCGKTDDFKLDINDLRSSPNPYDNVQDLIENIDPQLATELGRLIIMYVNTMVTIDDATDLDNKSKAEGKCPNCGRNYDHDDLPSEDDPTFQLIREWRTNRQYSVMTDTGDPVTLPTPNAEIGFQLL